MAKLKRLWLIVDTADVRDAGADSRDFQLIVDPPGSQIVRLKFGNPDGNNLERERADIYKWSVVEEKIDTKGLTAGRFRIKNKSSDGWLPKSIFVVGQTTDGKYQLFVARGSWPKKWFDNEDEANRQPEWPLDVRD